LPAKSDGGTYMRLRGYDTLSVQPPRFRVRFAVMPTHLFGMAFCGLEVIPASGQGSPIRTICSCEAPPGTTWTIDSVGVALFTPNPCRPAQGSGGAEDSLALIIDGVPAWFNTGYYTTPPSGAFGDWLYVTPDAVTPTQRKSWGRLKSHYR
jgi:hypothetical protein